jgi:transposase
MYLRHTTVRKNGKPHTYWRLVRSVRKGAKVVQETVATLGELDAEGRAKARALAESLGARRRGPSLFDPEPLPSEPVPVRLDKVRLERPRAFGAVWLGLQLWQALRFDVFLAERMERGREDVPWATMAAVLVLARLCEPSSELHIAEDWYRSTALDDLIGVAPEKINDDRLYRALDHVLPLKSELEKHLRGRIGELFGAKYELLLYDMTSTYFEGKAERNKLAARGHSSDQRPDCKQVTIALVVTREGLPLGYEVFAGNRVGVTTVEEIVTAMEEKHGRAERIWVMDRGMVSEENLAFLREDGRRYLVGAMRGDLRKFAKELADKRDWKDVREGLEVKLVASPDGAETFVLCRSQDRREKEKAMHGRFAARIDAGLASLRRRIESSTKKLDRGLIERQIGRLFQRNSRAAGKYDVSLVERSDHPSGVALVVKIRQDWSDWAELSEGAYVLRTNVADWTPEELWRTYIQLTDAEAAFRIHKSDLSIRPVWHQTAERVQAHILVCFLAYVLWKTLEQWQSRAGLGNSPRTILTELARIQSHDVVLPLADGRDLRLRCVVRPDRAQALLLQRLGLDLPTRLRPREFARM